VDPIWDTFLKGRLFTLPTKVETTDSDKHSSLLRYGFDYDRKKFFIVAALREKIDQSEECEL
jgi:hypothetical protein